MAARYCFSCASLQTIIVGVMVTCVKEEMGGGNRHHGMENGWR
jgi:hypothetical protein